MSRTQRAVYVALGVACATTLALVAVVAALDLVGAFPDLYDGATDLQATLYKAVALLLALGCALGFASCLKGLAVLFKG